MPGRVSVLIASDIAEQPKGDRFLHTKPFFVALCRHENKRNQQGNPAMQSSRLRALFALFYTTLTASRSVTDAHAFVHGVSQIGCAQSSPLKVSSPSFERRCQGAMLQKRSPSALSSEGVGGPSSPSHGLNMMDTHSMENGSIVSAAVEVFDGSSVDPVVVSSVFWNSLKVKIISVVIGQFLAAAVFVALCSIAAGQLPKIGDFITSKALAGESGNKRTPRTEAEFSQSLGTSEKTSPDFVKLAACLAIDVIGSSSELIPVAGEITDIAWAPVAALALRSLYGSNVVFALEFAEEILPFTDILPLATICWVVETFYGEKEIAKFLQIGSFRSQDATSDGTNKVIDVDSDAVTPSGGKSRLLPSDSGGDDIPPRRRR